MNNIAQRTLSGLILILVVAGALIFSQLTYFLLFVVLMAASLVEFYQMMQYKGVKPHVELGIITGIYMFFASFLLAKAMIEPIVYILALPIFAGLFISELYRKEKQPFENLGATFTGLIYIALPISMVNFIVFSEGRTGYYPYVMLGIFAIIWSYDTLAFIIGYFMGSNPLFARISPRKTWEGVLGGGSIAFLVTWGISSLEPTLRSIDWFAITLIIIIFGTFGDLIESLLKRQVGMKDSGKLMPGHGGMLDRFDSLLFSLPIIYMYLKLIKTDLIF